MGEHNPSLTGFTLIELIMVIVIIGLLVGIGGPVAIKLVDSYKYSIHRKDLSQSAETAFRRMSREIRRLKNNTSVITANATSYSFVDIDNNTMQFQLNGSNLERSYNGTADTLVSNVSSFTFSYLDGNGDVIPAPLVSPQATDIRFVQIDMSLSSNNNTVYFRTKIRLRNILQVSDLFS